MYCDWQTERQKQRSTARSLHADCRRLGNLSASVVSGLSLTMDVSDLLSPPAPFDGTTSTPCLSTASSFVTTSSYCDDIFRFDDPFYPEQLDAEVASLRARQLRHAVEI